MKNKLENNIVALSNDLIEAFYVMSVNELKLFEMCLSQIDSRKHLETDKVFTIKLDDVINLFYTEDNYKNAYRDLRAVSEKLFRREALMQISPDEVVLTHFVQSIRFIEREKKVELMFATEIIPFISQLEKHFTTYRLKYTKDLKSVYSHRLYQFIVQWFGQGLIFKEMNLSLLKSFVANGLYPLNANFKARVLDVAVKEINEYSDMKVEYLLLKRSKKFDTVQFKFSRKPDIAKVEQEHKQKRLAATEANQEAKLTRLEKEQAEANLKAYKELEKIFIDLPEGTIINDQNGFKFVKKGKLMQGQNEWIKTEGIINGLASGFYKIQRNKA